MSPNIAPIHATIIQKNGCMFFQPVGSAPTGLNGYAVDSAWLSDGDVLGIGGLDLVFYGRSRPPADAPAAVRSMAAPEPMVRRDFRLIDSMGTVHSLAQGQSTIGRDKDNSICLSWDPSVSRMHAAIDVQGDVVSVRDMASQAGVRVGPALVREQVLKPGDVITLGKTTLTFKD
jgi:pSer/pThr/pTyr-binding forkhead associated (FHA) protein